MTTERKTAIMPPKKQPEQPKKKKATAEDKVSFDGFWGSDRQGKAMANTELLQNRPLG